MSEWTIAVASSESVIGQDPDQPVLDDALRARGCAVVVCAWDDPDVRWSTVDLVLVRSTWDYVDRREQFCAWAERVAAQTSVHNPPELIRWNTDKRYLADLAAVGLAVTPTTWLQPGDDVSLPDGPAQVVVKPTVSAGSRDTTRHDLDRDRDGARAAVGSLLDAGRSVMVQPYLDAVDTRGETGLVYVDGVFHHAFRKSAILVEGGAPTEHLYAPEQITPTVATDAERALAERTLASVPGPPLAYARVDVAPGPDDRPLIMELELVEPSLFFAACDETADALAGAVVTRLESRDTPI